MFIAMKKTNEELKELKEEVKAPAKKAAKTTTKKTTAKKAEAKSDEKKVAKKTATKKTATKTATKKTTTKKAEAKSDDKVVAKKTTAKKTATKATTKTATKKTTTKKAEAKSDDKKVAKKTAAKETATKATTKTAAKKTTTKKAEAKSDDKKVVKKTAAKKTATKATTKTAAKKTTTKKTEPKSSSSVASKVVKKATKTPIAKAADIDVIPETLKEVLRSNDSVFQAEYYDLPYRYNETTIKILAQSPHSLFLYWDVSDNDRKNFIDKYGESFFFDTKPVLLVHNKTQNYSFEVEVDDFTNSWYLRTPTSDCVFDIELARKDISPIKKYNFQSEDNRLHISDSNNLSSPNDHIRIETLSEPITFKNIKTNQLEEKIISNADALKAFYKDFEVSNEVFNNPSSNFRI